MYMQKYIGYVCDLLHKFSQLYWAETGVHIHICMYEYNVKYQKLVCYARWTKSFYKFRAFNF